jgi:DNA mismatch repair ATPase MutL
LAKKSKKRRPGGGRPQPARAQSTKPQSTKGQSAKGQSTKGQSTKGQSTKGQSTKAQSTKAQSTKAQTPKAQSTKGQRIEAARRARRRKSLVGRLAVAGIAGILVAFLAIRALSGSREGDAVRAQLTAGSCEYDTKADATDAAPRNHVATPTYEVDPPAGGNHTPQAARPAAYSEGQVPSDGQVVHAMEHGDVVLWHRPDLSAEDRGALQKVFDTYERDVLVVPRATLATPVAATAWGRRLLCNTVEPAALDLFTRTYRDKGPEKLPE